MRVQLWIAALVLGVALPGQAQGPVLVQDIATGSTFSPGSSANPPVRFRGEDYFGADDGFLGDELWATNGTQRGTRLVADLCPGRCQGGPWVLTPSGDLLYFFAGNTTFGNGSFWLWRSDGTAEGTFPLVDLEIPGFGAAGPAGFLAPFRSGVVFIVHDRVRRAWSLWGSDGTRPGTREIAPLPGRYSSNDTPLAYDWPRIQNAPGKHSFTWQGRPWATDGTAAGTGPVATPVRRPCGGWARTGVLVVYAGEEETRLDCEPWVSDGTARGTLRLRDVWRGEDSSYPDSFVAAGGLVYFVAFGDHGHRQLWQTDGTPRGTRLVRAPATRGLGKVTIVGTAGARIYFAADDGEHGTELWRSEGTPDSTALVADLSPGAAGSSLASGGQSLGDQFFFAAATGETAGGLYRTRGAAGSTELLSDYGLTGGSALAAVGNRVYFTGFFEEVGAELGVTDGTAEGTRILDLARPVASSDPHQLIAGAGGLTFLATEDEFGADLWRSGGHRWDTEPLADLVPGSFFSDGLRLAPGSGGAFYYTIDEKRFGWTDGQTVRDLLPPGSLLSPQGFIDLDGGTLFFAGRLVSETDGTSWQSWIWSSDGTPEGTAPAAAVSSAGHPVFFLPQAGRDPRSGSIHYLVQDAPEGPESLAHLSATDGTAAGTRELVRFPVGRFQSPSGLVTAGLYTFASFRSDFRASLWASDGTAEGTREIYTLSRPWDLSFVSELTAAGEQAFFLGDSFEHGRELWASDGTPEGTRRVADLAPGAASSAPSDLFAAGDRIFFSADDGTHGRELWVSDGTEAGTRRLEINPGPRGSYPQAFRAIGDRVVFAADDGAHGLEAWVTDGTLEGTRLAADVMPGPWSSSPRDFAVFGDELFFSAGRPREGYELWKLPLAVFE